MAEREPIEKRDRIWQAPYIERRRQQILKQVASTQRMPTTTKLRQMSMREEYSERLDAYLYAIESVGSPKISSHDKPELLNIASDVLQAMSVDPERSRLAYLYRRLQEERGKMAALDGKHWAAHWLKCLADETEGLAMAPYEWKPADSPGKHPPPRLDPMGNVEEQFIQLLNLRASGSAKEAHYLVDTLLIPESATAAFLWRIEWFRLSLRMQLDSNEAAFRDALGHKRRLKLTELLEIHLWAFVSPSKKALEWVGPPDFAEDGPLASYVHSLAEAYRDTKTPARARAQAIGAALSAMVDEPAPQVDLETMALVWASAARWMLRHKRIGLHRVCMHQYRAASRHLSGGVNDDVLGVFTDPGPTLVSLPTSQLQRLAAVGRLAAAIGKVAASHLVRSPFRSKADSERRSDETLKTFCSVVYRYSDQLKGGWMKLGQAAAYLGPDLPGEARAILSELHQASTAMDSSVTEAVVQSEFGTPVEELFAYWNRCPLATGSIGQVHRARLHSGEEVVVKVQYPNIRQILGRDIQSLSLLIPLVRPFFRHWDFNGLLREMESRFLEECDYRGEAENQLAIRRAFAGDPEIVVPQLHPQFCSAKVLTSQYIPGRRFSEFAKQASQDERNRAAAIMTRWHWTSIFQHQVFSGDPHPGNFLFLPGQVAFIDYGNVKRWDGVAWQGIGLVMEGLLHDRFELFARGYALAQVSTDHGAVVREEFGKIRQHILGYLREDREIEFDHRKALEYFRSCTTANPNTRHTVRVTRDSAILFKAHWSFFATVGQLNPSVNWRQVYLSSKGSF